MPLDLEFPKFKRDPQNISDIKGTKSKYKIKSKEIIKTNYVKDINGEKKLAKIYKNDAKWELENIRAKKFTTKRCINPL